MYRECTERKNPIPGAQKCESMVNRGDDVQDGGMGAIVAMDAMAALGVMATLGDVSAMCAMVRWVLCECAAQVRWGRREGYEC